VNKKIILYEALFAEVNDFAEGPCNRENVFSRRVTGFHRRPKVLEVNFFIRKTFLRLSNQAGKIIFTAGQFACCLALYETPATRVYNSS